MKAKQLYPGVVFLEFATQKEMTVTMCRVQEFYESDSSKIRNKKFSWEDFLHTYTEENGEIDYFHRVVGFNIPSKYFNNFVKTFKLNKQEDEMVQKVYSLVNKKHPFTVIATKHGEPSSTKKHELAHAFYSLNKGYKKAVNEIIGRIPKRQRALLKAAITKHGYADKVVTDEMNAYLATSTRKQILKLFEYDTKSISQHADELKTLLKELLKLQRENMK